MGMSPCVMVPPIVASAEISHGLPVISRGVQPDGEVGAMNNLGAALRRAGRYEEAVTARQDAIGIFRETGDVPSEAVAQFNLEAAISV